MMRGTRWALPMMLALTLGGCAATDTGGVPQPVPTSSGGPATSSAPPEVSRPVGEPTTIAEGLTSPWSIVRLQNGSTLVSERDTGAVKEITADGEVREAGVVDGVVPGGEGGLLGLAVAPSADGDELYAYFTAADDNRIVRMALEGDAGALSLGAADEVLTGIAKAGNHNGGRIGFGPDGMLYATTGDAGDRDASQDPESLNGKILRMTPAGAAPDDNPFTGSLTWSLGHRNPQGIAWDDSGQLWAAEFGQDTWDELNVITAGSNYGWPIVEGVTSDARFINPVVQWPTDDASPSGLTFADGTFYMAALKGERLWSITTVDGAQTAEWYTGEYGRLRDVVPGPDGTVWMVTSNTDGRGDARPGDDKLLEVQLESMTTG